MRLPTTPSPSDAPRSASTADRILTAAEEIFIRFGYEGARMDQIAERAGVRKANIYYYFASKSDLYHALIERILSDVVSEVRSFLMVDRLEGKARWEMIDTFLDLLFRLVERYRGLIGLAFSELIHPPRGRDGTAPMAHMLEQIESIGRQMILDGIREGVFRDQDPAQAVVTMEGALFYYFVLPDERLRTFQSGDKFSPENLDRRKRHLADVLRRLLAP